MSPFRRHCLAGLGAALAAAGCARRGAGEAAAAPAGPAPGGPAATGAAAPAAPQAGVSAPVAPRSPPPRYRLVFEDDFDDDSLARFNEQAQGGRRGAPAWRSRYRHPRKDVINGEKQIYMDPAFGGDGDAPLGVQPFAIRDGVLSIRADRADPQRVSPRIWGHRYTSGCITTELTHWQTYGYFEMRARLPKGKGLWPAFWLLPRREAWPPEIDVLEASGLRPGEVHCGIIDRQPSQAGATSGWVRTPPPAADGFAVFAAEWTRDEIAFSVDGHRLFAVRDHRIHEDMYLLANLAVGSRDPYWIPDPDERTPFPAAFEIDYIRAYARE